MISIKLNRKIIVSIIIGICIFTAPNTVDALREYYQRDYIMDRYFHFRGNKPRIGMAHVLSFIKREQSTEQTYILGSYYHAVKFLIEPLVPDTSVVIQASEPSSPRILKAIYAHDDLRYPVEIWTDTYWYPEYECNESGCSRVKCLITRGEARVTVVDLR